MAFAETVDLLLAVNAHIAIVAIVLPQDLLDAFVARAVTTARRTVGSRPHENRLRRKRQNIHLVVATRPDTAFRRAFRTLKIARAA